MNWTLTRECSSPLFKRLAQHRRSDFRLEALYDVRPTAEELDSIAEAIKKYPDGILDKPEQFVLMMAMTGNLDERLKVGHNSCDTRIDTINLLPHFIKSWIFMKKFPDRVLDFTDQLNTLSSICVQVVKK